MTNYPATATAKAGRSGHVNTSDGALGKTAVKC